MRNLLSNYGLQIITNELVTYCICSIFVPGSTISQLMFLPSGDFDTKYGKPSALAESSTNRIQVFSWYPITQGSWIGGIKPLTKESLTLNLKGHFLRAGLGISNFLLGSFVMY